MLSKTKKGVKADLIGGKEWKVLLAFSLPILFSYLLQQVYTLSDAAIVGQTLSSDDVAGVNDVSPLVFIFLQFAFGCTAGFSVITAHCFGTGDKAGVRRSFAVQIVVGVIVSIILTALAILLLNPLLAWINITTANYAVYKAAYNYCFVIYIGILAQMFYNLICSVLRSVGDAVTPLIFLLISTALNVGLDLLFIIPFGWGVIGAAAATILAQAISAVACLVYTFVKYPDLRLKSEDFKITSKDIKEHLAQGLPLGLQFSVLAIGIIVMQSVVVKFDFDINGIMVSGNPAQNGYGAACKLGNFLMTTFNALGTAVVSFNAQNLGAGKKERVRRGTLQALLMAFIAYIIVGIIGMLTTINGAYQRLFLSADKISERSLYYGNVYLYVALSCYFLLGALFVLRSAAQGIGKSGFTLLAGCMELVARVVVCLFLPSAINGGAINAEASVASYIALCFADPLAWLGSVLALIYPFVLICKLRI